ncbi:MAG: potassium-transporting ATPase subunit B, partial [Syntrophaceae bacterium]|nr:potassium-transporting ATPase subunit B [Syntrophaceae bacterium]
MARKEISILDSKILRQSILGALSKLNPLSLAKNPVIFVTEIGALATIASVIFAPAHGSKLFELQIAIWLWLTVLFANFAEALAEGKGKAQANALRSSRTQVVANRLSPDGVSVQPLPADQLRRDDRVVVCAGEIIPADGEVIEGVASVDESAITGESAPVIREAGGDRSGVTGGTRVLSDRIIVQVTTNPGESFLDHMISIVEGAKRQKTPNEIALTILLAA